MGLRFQQVHTHGIAQMSYMVADDESRTGAVIDPRPDARVYLETARKWGVSLTHVFETHIHADFMSGARELVARLGSACWCVSVEEGSGYGFDRVRVCHGDRFEFGALTLTARHTPGHTPEHLSYELAEKGKADSPWGVLTGDSLFVGSAGRPDLLGEEETEELVEKFFQSLRDYFLSLQDGVLIFPCHGSGSACGKAIGDRPVSSIGFERKRNPFLQYSNLKGFKEFVLGDSPPVSRHYSILKRINREGPSVLGNVPAVPGLSPEAFRETIQNGNVQVLDTRQMLAFGGGCILGALNIEARPELSVWAGQMLDYEQPILLILEDDENLEEVAWLLVNTGFTQFAGYLAGGMRGWEDAGFPMDRIPQIGVHELQARKEEMRIFDVRTEEEWRQGRIPRAVHLPLSEMREGLNGNLEVSKSEAVAVYCATGFRGNIAASLLKQFGYRTVLNIPGGWQAWKRAGYETES